MVSELQTLLDASMESSLTILMLVLAYKIYKMKVDLSSKCFKKDGNGIEITTHNEGGADDIV